MRPLDNRGETPAPRGHSHICQKLRFMGIDSVSSFPSSWTVPAFTVHKLPPGLDLRTGAPVIISESSEYRLQFARGLGFEAFSLKETNLAEWLREQTNGSRCRHRRRQRHARTHGQHHRTRSPRPWPQLQRLRLRLLRPCRVRVYPFPNNERDMSR